MGEVFWHVTMSLDGFIAGPGDDMDWMTRVAGPNPVVDGVVQSIGAALIGRRTYDVGRRPGLRPEFRKIYGGAWNGPVFVLTHHAPEAEEDATITFLSTDIRSAVATALQAAGGKNLLLLGADIARQCLEADLVDEILVHVAPVLLGDGVRLFARHAAAPIELETIAVSQAGQITNLRFRVLKGKQHGNRQAERRSEGKHQKGATEVAGNDASGTRSGSAPRKKARKARSQR